MEMKAIDLHCDTISALLRKKDAGNPYSLAKNDLHVDLEKMRAGDYLLQNFAMFIYVGSGNDPFEECMQMIDLYEEVMEQEKNQIAPVLTFADIEKNEKAGKLSSMLTIEEGAVIRGSIEKLHTFYNRGVRMMTLTWNYPNEIGYPNCLNEKGEPCAWGIPNTTNGLTPFGIECVQEMQRMGMIVDVSHLSDAGFYDMLKYTDKPFVASHSNARAVGGHSRNMTDDMLKKLADRGGVLGMNYCGGFLSMEQDYDKAEGTVDMIVDHIRHIRNVAGCDCIALGSDFDGIPTHKELPDASHLPKLSAVLEKAGFTYTEIEKIFSGNVLRVYRDCLK